MTGELDPLTLEPLLPPPGASAGDAAADPFFKYALRHTGTAPLNAPLALDSAAVAAAPAQRNTMDNYLTASPSEAPPPGPERSKSSAGFGPVATAVPPKPQAVAPALQRAPSAFASKYFILRTPTLPLSGTNDGDEEVDQGMCVCEKYELLF